MDFHLLRRQKFLSEDYYIRNVEEFHKSLPPYLAELNAESSSAYDCMLVAAAIAHDVFADFLLQYTGGISLEILRVNIENVLAAFEQSAEHERNLANDSRFPPLRFTELAQYERTMQLIGACYLLHRRDLLPRVAKLFDGAFAATDTLYEDLLAYELVDRFDVDEWHHDRPYRDLINSLYRDTPEESIADLEKYLRNWYSAMADVPWHDSHLRMSNGGGGYFGYWAIEAGAVAYLLKLDDRSFRECIVYPKDLVDYARKLDDDS